MTLNDDPIAEAVAEMDRRFQEQVREWPLVTRNRAITARNRFYAAHAEWLGLNPDPMPLEKPLPANAAAVA